jgi:hypothetical protein
LNNHWTMSTVKALVINLPCILSETCGKIAEAAKYSLNFSTCGSFSMLCHTHSRIACAAHQAVTIKHGVYCVHVCNFSILVCIVLTVALMYKIFWKSTSNLEPWILRCWKPSSGFFTTLCYNTVGGMHGKIGCTLTFLSSLCQISLLSGHPEMGLGQVVKKVR